MPDYRAYFVGIDGPFSSTRAEFLPSYPDDATAIEAAKQLVHDYDVELWDGDRFVGRFSADAKKGRWRPQSGSSRADVSYK